MTHPKARLFWPLAALLLLADCSTKQLVEEQLVEHLPQAVIGNALQFTLIYNRGAAFSTSLGDYSRVIFSVLAMVIVLVLYRMYRDADATDRSLGAALGLIVGGAVGNLVDRLRSPRGVVDFIDVGIGDARFWVFNIADVGVTAGAALLLYIMLRRSQAPEPELE